MKLSNISLQSFAAEDDLSQLYREINNTANAYPKDKSIVDLFNEMAERYPQKTAVRLNDARLTYDELHRRSNQLAHWLLDKGIRPESAVAICLDRSIDMVTAILGILKAGAAYLPLNVEYPVERNRAMLEEAHASVLIGHSAFMREINQLQWLSPHLHSVLCIDSNDFYGVMESANPLMKKELWEFVGETADDDIAGGGWTSSYTGEKLSRTIMDEYAANALAKLRPYLGPSKKVLEIGCASGITMYQVAPEVKQYYGTDLSQSIIDYNETKCRTEGFDNITLQCKSAWDIDTLGTDGFDIVITNSVIQAFNGLNYLRQIIAKAGSLLNTKGILFFGDVMDADRMDDLLRSVQEYKKQNPGAATKLDFSHELFVSADFFRDCRVEFPWIKNVIVTPKIFTVDNELTAFRYDVILEVDKEDSSTPEQKCKYQFDARALRSFSEGPVGVKVDAGQLSNIMFTSGSTGTPKGVLIEHHCIVRLVVGSPLLDTRAEDNWLLTAEISFDPSCMEMFGALLNGATLCLVQKEILLDAEALYRYMRECKITILQLVTALFHRLADQKPDLFGQVRKLMVGGEVLSPTHVRNVRAHSPGLTIINAYGPTENCVVSTAFPIDGDYPVLPIGRPIPNSGIYILDNDLQLMPAGVTGELFLTGDGLARGYLGNPADNAGKFLNDPFVPGRRMYRTGDLVRLQPDHTLEFIGRKDSQVKVNGHRVELSEIEHALKDIPAVSQAVIAIRGRNKQLCAYITTSDNITDDNVRRLLSVRLPAHMIPTHFIRLDHFPMTTNAKIDMQRLPDPDELDEDQTGFVEPANEIERKLAAIFGEILDRSRISTDRDFFRLGGHSLLATQLLSRINKEFNIGLRLKTIFNYPTVAALSAEIAAAEEHTWEDIPAVPVSDVYSLSHAQQRLWVMHQIPGFRTAYNMQDVFQLKGAVNYRLLERAFRLIVTRHESLRTAFVLKDGEPVQKIADPGQMPTGINFLDLRIVPDKEELALRMIKEEGAFPFDLETGSLIRLSLLQMETDRFLLLLCMHHIISDGWSLWIFVNELMTLYEALSHGNSVPQKPLRIQYKDYAAWQNAILQSPEQARLRQYWLAQFSGPLPELKLRYDHPRPETFSTAAGKISVVLPEETSRGLRNLCQRGNATLFMGIRSLVNIILHRHTGQYDIVIGSPIAGRDNKDLENQIGLFLNTLALRSKIDPEQHFSDYLQTVAVSTLEAQDHQMYPFDLLIEELKVPRNPNRSPLFDVGLTWHNIDGPERDSFVRESGNIHIEGFKYEGQKMKADLWFHGWEGESGAIHISLLYNLSLFERMSIDRIMTEFTELASAVVQHPDDSIAALSDRIAQKEKQRKMANMQKSADQKLDKFFQVKRKPISLNTPLVSESFLPDHPSHPLVIKPEVDGLILTEWIRNNQTHIGQLLQTHGAILFRNFTIGNMAAFQQAAAAVSDRPMTYMDQSSPRTLLSDKTYTSTDHPQDQVINMHNELSYSHDWPMQILFFCLIPPGTDGETPIADSARVLQALSADTRAKFESKGILYVRNLVKGLGLSWQDVYQTTDRTVVEKYCREREIRFEWIDDDNLRIQWRRPAIRPHPVKGTPLWFNHGFFFNAFNLDESVHEAVGSRERLPFDTFYGDGTPIEREVFEELRKAYAAATISFPWQQDDILLLDNMQMSHGRNSYTGERKILVAMNDPFSQIATTTNTTR